MKKRLLSAALCLCMLLTLLPTVAFADGGNEQMGYSTAILHDESGTYQDDELYDAGSYQLAASMETGGYSVSATNLKQHQNGQNTMGYWAGVAVTAPANATQMKVAMSTTAAPSLEDVTATALEEHVFVDEEGTAYDGVAFYADTAKVTTLYCAVQWLDADGKVVTSTNETGTNEVYSFTADFSGVTHYVAPMTASELQAALNAAASSEDKTVTLTSDVVVGDAGLTSYGAAAITIPEGVTLDGGEFSIIAENWTSTNQYHILGVSETADGTTTTIKNLSIVGSANTKSGIHAYKCEGTVAISGVTITNCGNAAVQVNGSKVTADGLTTSGNAWGAVNVDKGSGVTSTATFNFDNCDFSEPTKVWTELTAAENGGTEPVTVPDTWVPVLGSTTTAYAPEDSLTKQVVKNENTGAYYQTLEYAVKDASANDALAVYPGNYNISFSNYTVSGYEAYNKWYLAIDKAITIKGVDENGAEITDATKTAAKIYSTDYTANGSWNTQSLIMVFADNVTISGVTIMNKIDANKAVEVYAGADNFTVKNCTFAPIAEELLEGLNSADLGGYTYEEYKEYGASLYFNGNVTDAIVEGNYFDHSGITLDSTSEAVVTVTSNTFDGVKNWNNDPDYMYSSIGYTSWANPAVTDITNADITIEGNQLINAGKVNFSKVTNGSVDVSGNYWEGMDLSSDVTGSATISTVYADKEMTTLVDVAGGEETLQDKLDAAKLGDVIDLEGKYWPGNLKITTPVTLKNGYVDTVTAIGAMGGLTFDNITFRGASNAINLDTNNAALYLQGTDKISNVLIDNCTFQGPASEDVTVAIATTNVENLTVQNSTIDGYTITAYHNPGNGGNISYLNNEIRNVTSGIAFIGTDGITVTGNTFENANGIRLEPSWSNSADKCSDITISENKFVSVSKDDTYGQYAVRLQNSTGAAGVDGEVALDHNYWGSANPDFGTLIIAPDGQKIVTEPYYKADTMRPEDLNTYVPSGGGGGTVSSSYAITVSSSTNGSVTVSPTKAAEGATVTITVKPDDGYVLNVLTVKDASGKTIAVTESNGKYTFKMPGSAVTVSATFKAESSSLPFTDVATGDWFYEAVKYAYDNSMMNGVGHNLFAPSSNLTRGMIAQVLYNLEGTPAAGSSAFTDVAADQWYANAVNWAAANDIVGGYGNGKFGPEDDITREQMAQILYNYAAFKGYDVSAQGDLATFNDGAKTSDWALAAMKWAVGTGLLQGYNGNLNPTGTATRAEVAQILMNFCENIVK
jgi:hypothetical protein